MPSSKLTFTPENFHALLVERNRYRRTLRRIAKGTIALDGTRVAFSPNVCATLAKYTLKAKPRKRKFK